MVKGTDYSKIHFICGNHGDDKTIEMYMHEGAAGMSSFYACPKYISNLKPEEGRSCYNRMTTSDFLKVVDILNEEKYPDDGQIIALKGLRFSIKNIDFKVIEEKKDELWIEVFNKKAIQTRK